MVDCSITTTVAERVAVSATVAQRSTITASVTGRTRIACRVASRSTVSCSVSEPTAVTCRVAEREPITCSVSERTTISAEVTMGGLTGWDRAKLDSIDWGATNRQPDIVKLAYATEKSVTSNDSDDWDLTDTYQEIIQFLVPQPAWRGTGYLEFDVTASFTNSAGAGTETVTFELERAPVWPTTPGTDPSLFGLPQTWVSVATFTSLAIPAGGGIGVFTFLFRGRANGHAGTVFRQTWGGLMLWDDLSGGGEPLRRDFLRRTAVDPTEDMLYRLKAKTDYVTGTGKLFSVKGASCIFICPRDGSDL